MATFEETVMKAKDVLDIAGKKTEEIINIQKLKMRSASVMSQMGKDFEAIGRLCYDAEKTNADNDQAIGELIAAIDDKNEQLRDIKEKLAELKGGKVCTGCGAVNPADTVFCPECGKKQ